MEEDAYRSSSSSRRAFFASGSPSSTSEALRFRSGSSSRSLETLSGTSFSKSIGAWRKRVRARRQEGRGGEGMGGEGRGREERGKKGEGGYSSVFEARKAASTWEGRAADLGPQLAQVDFAVTTPAVARVEASALGSSAVAP